MDEQRPRTAVITGGSSGIGLAAGELLASKGYDVVLTARGGERLRKAAERIGARWFAVDAVDEAAMETMFAEVGTVDLLVHSAGVFRAAAMRRQPAEDFENIVSVNLTSAYIAGRSAVAKMGAGGRVIFVSSVSGIDGHPWLTGYAASKAAVRMMAESMRGEVEKVGISVHVLTLPTVDTPMMAEVARPAILVEDCANAIAWLDTVHPRVRIPELVIRSADDSPFVHYTPAWEAAKEDGIA